MDYYHSKMPATKKLPSLVETSIQSLSDNILDLVFAGVTTEDKAKSWAESLSSMLTAQLENGVRQELSQMLWTKLSAEFDNENSSKKKPLLTKASLR